MKIKFNKTVFNKIVFNKIHIIIMIVILILIIRNINYKEGNCSKKLNDEDKELMNEYVKKYPTDFSVDPLYNSKFKPECCPNMYTSSSGCLCIDKDNFSLIHSRGGNSYNFEYGNHVTPETLPIIDTYS